MTNYFLKVNKDLFKRGLNPLEILLISQIAEFQGNTGDCFISDKALAENFGVSESTITRTLKALESKGYIVRETKNVKGGKERHIKVNERKLKEDSTTSKMTLDGGIQASKCLLSTSNLTVDNKQNDLIKDNIKYKEKDNNSEEFQPTAESSSLAESQKQEVIEVDGVKAQLMTRNEALSKYGLDACANKIPTAFSNCFWISGELVKLT